MHKLRFAWASLVLLLFSLHLSACADNDPGAGVLCEEGALCDDGGVCVSGVCEPPDEEPTPEPTNVESESGNYTDRCTSDKDCDKGLSCIQTVQNFAICTRLCPPDGGNEVCTLDSGDLLMECVGIRPDAGDIVHVCLPRPDTYCKVCEREEKDVTGACGTAGLDLCRQQNDGDYRCAIACSKDLACPEGSTCEQVQELHDDEPVVYDVCVPDTGYCQKCVDEDGDGYGNPNFDMSDCRVPNVPDCNDNDGDIHPDKVAQCNGKDDACQGRVDHDYRNEDGAYATLAHCGACHQPCALAHAVTQCDTGTCTFVECERGWVNLHGDEDIAGCPYECTPQPEKGEDLPSDLRDPSQSGAAEDLNCDGVDGDASRALFVAKTGRDTNPGTRAQPLQTIGAALNALSVMSTELDQIYVSRGDYTEDLTLVDGVSIYGGFDAAQDWARSKDYDVRIIGGHLDSGNRIGLKGRNLEGSGLTIVQNLTVRAQDATGYVAGKDHGASSYGLHCTNCPSLVLRGMIIEAGKGANGRGGSAGARPSDFRPESCHGGHGEMAGSGNPANGPDGGASFLCNGPDGISTVWTLPGGKGGDASNDMGGDGGDGGSNARGQSGGAGGEGVGPGCNSVAEDGGLGLDGLTGTQGTGSRQPTTLTAGGLFVPQDGAAGSLGAAGTGGGGGGGGATHTATLAARRHSGGPGGAGGSGGCPGGGGSAGGSGGSSIALTLIDSSDVTIERVRLVASSAGNGAEGGAGGVGRPGCNGGKGDTGGTANVCSRAGGDGGDGKAGGHGGQGGAGGGGAGGSTIGAIFKNSSKSNGPATPYESVNLPASAGAKAGNGAAGLRTEERVFP